MDNSEHPGHRNEYLLLRDCLFPSPLRILFRFDSQSISVVLKPNRKQDGISRANRRFDASFGQWFDSDN
jgi:hypothetical protein